MVYGSLLLATIGKGSMNKHFERIDEIDNMKNKTVRLTFEDGKLFEIAFNKEEEVVELELEKKN